MSENLSPRLQEVHESARNRAKQRLDKHRRVMIDRRELNEDMARFGLYMQEKLVSGYGYYTIYTFYLLGDKKKPFKKPYYKSYAEDMYDAWEECLAFMYSGFDHD